mmetsp:Transcript_44493/g.137589  ORF Transcript_44493/g.137589 Transcript_44493/m.137589 type:complete len:504 (-) Transcript_44493:14-1525(-)
MPAADARKRRRVVLGLGEGCAWHIQRQLEEIKRQKARVEAGAVRRTTAEPAKTSAAHPPARLTAASGLVARRLGVPLRGANDGSSRKRSRGVASTAVTKQQVFSDEEGGQSDAPPQADAPGYGYGNGATSNGSDGGGESRKVRHVRSRGHATVVSSRGRNIVGTLLGHLASARQRLAEERRARKAATGAHATDAAGPSTQEPPDAPEGPRRWATERRARARRREAAGRREPSEESNAAEDEEADERLDEQAAVAEETEEEEQEEARDSKQPRTSGAMLAAGMPGVMQQSAADRLTTQTLSELFEQASAFVGIEGVNQRRLVTSSSFADALTKLDVQEKLFQVCPALKGLETPEVLKMVFGACPKRLDREGMLRQELAEAVLALRGELSMNHFVIIGQTLQTLERHIDHELVHLNKHQRKINRRFLKLRHRLRKVYHFDGAPRKMVELVNEMKRKNIEAAAAKVARGISTPSAKSANVREDSEHDGSEIALSEPSSPSEEPENW